VKHEITVHRNRNKRWFAACSCRRWTSNTYLLRNEAITAGEVHVFKGDAHLRALAQFQRGKARVNLASELKWYEEQAENLLNSREDREMWQLLADELRPRVHASDEDQMTLFDTD
jgi:hypothetical protein